MNTLNQTHKNTSSIDFIFGAENSPKIMLSKINKWMY